MNAQPTNTEITPTAENITADNDTAENVTAGSVIEGTDFEDLWSEEVPTLVDFWAEWCGPCHAVAPAVESMAEAYAGQLRVVKVNIDQHPEIAQSFGVMSIPTLVVTKDNAEVARQVGAVPRHVLDEMVKPHL